MKSAAFGMMALALTALPLAGCSSALSGSAYGTSGKVASLDLPSIGNITADAALVEARGHFKASDFGYSAALYKKVVELNPKDPQGYVGLGASYDRMGRFDLADRVYATLFQISGGTVQYYNNVGYSYLLRGNLPQALSNFRKAKALAPDNAVVANNLQMLAQASAV